MINSYLIFGRSYIKETKISVSSRALSVVPTEQIILYIINTFTSWAMNETDKKRLGTWEGKILGRIYGPVGEQGMWRVSTNQEMSALYKDVDIAAGFKKKRLGWIGYVARIDLGTVKKISESKSEGSKKVGDLD